MKTARIYGNGGTVTFDATSGQVLDIYNQSYPPVKLDLREFKNFYGCEIENDKAYDILDFGFWDARGEYTAPVREFVKPRQIYLKLYPCGQMIKFAFSTHDLIKRMRVMISALKTLKADEVSDWNYCAKPKPLEDYSYPRLVVYRNGHARFEFDNPSGNLTTEYFSIEQLENAS